MRGRRFLGVVFLAVFAANSACTQYTGTRDSLVQRRDTHERLNGLLWVQTSAEYHVISASVYRDAWKAVDRLLADAKAGKMPPSAAPEQTGNNTANLPLAIVVDIDETLLDNSPMSGKLVTERKGYDDKVWSDWVTLEQAKYIVGAEEFITKSRAAGVEVFFVTNRTEGEEASTIKDLLPIVVTDDQILASAETGKGESKPWESEKSGRRAFLAKTHWIIAMVGDDLGDFIPGIRKMPPADRVTEASKYLERFGNQWFLLPNPLYGSWEAVLYNRNDPDEKQLSDKIGKVKAY